jgi:DNA-binding SARP family transcriptional activator
MLLRGFELRTVADAVMLPLSAQRLVAFLALQAHPIQRLYVAGKLRIDASEAQACASLRSTLWRVNRAVPGLVVGDGQRLALNPGVRVDVIELTARAQQLIEPSGSHDLHDLPHLREAGDLLPDWYDDWIVIERERFRQLRLHALEALCGALVSDGRLAEAADAGLAAVCDEPLRESAHRALISVYLAEGNVGEALRQYSLCRRMLDEHLDMRPSPSMERLIEAARSDAARDRQRPSPLTVATRTSP